MDDNYRACGRLQCAFYVELPGKRFWQAGFYGTRRQVTGSRVQQSALSKHALHVR
jgi:hypothetical protein